MAITQGSHYTRSDIDEQPQEDTMEHISFERCLRLTDRLEQGRMPSPEETSAFIDACAPAGKESHLPENERRLLLTELFARARSAAVRSFGRRIYLRGLIEISNHCVRNCLYCGIRAGNALAERYRLSPEEIFACCERGHGLGFRTFVLQGGEDPWFSDVRLCAIVRRIKERWPDCAGTLSAGERPRVSYRRLRDAGADRFLLRHGTADPGHYARLHPPAQTWQERVRCLCDLKDCGYQTGAGFMVGSPWQDSLCLAKDLAFLAGLRPEMVGIGPFIPQAQTPLAGFPAGSVDLTLVMIALTRLALPDAMLPSTTALATAAADGRERGILAGANVVMPNLSPREARRRYTLYDNKLAEGPECAEQLESLKRRMEAIGYEIVADRGDHRTFDLQRSSHV